MTTNSDLNPFSGFTKILISHANPEDNYFASWLATKLNLLGFDVWCDTQELKGGEDFWRDIEQVIRTKAIKVLFVVSPSSLEKRGTLKELALADKIRDRGDFLIPLRLVDVPHDAFPVELIRLNAIDFSSNWADGFGQLISKLKKDTIPQKLSFEVEQINDWWKSSILPPSTQLIRRDEPHWSNWFPCILPQSIYIHKVIKARNFLRVLPYPAIAEGDWLVTFASKDCISNYVSILHTEQYDLKDFISVKTLEVFSSHIRISGTNNKVVELLGLAFEKYAVEQGLYPYEMSLGNAFYFPSTVHDNLSTSRVKLERYGLSHVSLIGDSTDYQWHYAIQGRIFLQPKPIFWVSHHIVFTENGQTVDTSTQHRLRRKVGSGWYNKQWRDRLLAAMSLLAKKSDDTTLSVPVCCNQAFTIEIAPIKFVSPVGYNEPV